MAEPDLAYGRLHPNPSTCGARMKVRELTFLHPAIAAARFRRAVAVARPVAHQGAPRRTELHQDQPYWPRPFLASLCWVALQDAAERGCMT